MLAQPRRIARLGVAWLLVFTAVLWLVDRTRGHGTDIREALSDVPAVNVAVALLLMCVSLAFQAAYHVVVLRRLTPVSGRAAGAAYLQAQVVRYLPGKIWGLIYQVNRLGDRKYAAPVVLANLWQTLTSTMLTTVIVVGLTLSMYVSPWGGLLVPAGLLMLEGLHRSPIVERWIIRGMARFVPSSRLHSDPSQEPAHWRGTGLLCAEWIAYLAAFAALFRGMNEIAHSLALGIWYAGAAAAAMAAFVVPAGLAVREALFLSLPASAVAGTVALATTAILLRVVTLAAEMLLASGTLLMQWGRSK